ncbi:MAG: amidohydrolase [Kordiimonadaceae bacterium]|nr:amidohydrolase [Kordiimonadaceae bacterium]
MFNSKNILFIGVVCGLMLLSGAGRADNTTAIITQLSTQVAASATAWRHDFHEHPELPNREFRTAAIIAGHLRKLGFDKVITGVAHTGVVGVLKGHGDGPVVALRADMDALPVAEKTGLPFASTAKATYYGREVGVMHACGHDAHVAILMGAASVLSEMRAHIKGTVLFVFQPAEEGPPEGEEGGARLMIKEGLLSNYGTVDAIFGLHVWPTPAGQILYRAGGAMAAADGLNITVKGKQTHGSSPWRGIDPILVSAQIMTAIQAIPSRSLDITKAPSVISIGSIHGGVRGNIIPGEVKMEGTIRTFDPDVRQELLARLETSVKNIAEASGAVAEVEIIEYAPTTYNDPALTKQMVPSLVRALGAENVAEGPLVMASEDFSFYQREIPGLFVFLGVNKKGVSALDAAPNHSPYFHVNDAALSAGIKALSVMAVDYLADTE